MEITLSVCRRIPLGGPPCGPQLCVSLILCTIFPVACESFLFRFDLACLTDLHKLLIFYEVVECNDYVQHFNA